MNNNAYEYLNDKNFLLQLDKIKFKTLYAKIILLTWEEAPIQQIENKITTGNISVDGNSALQRSCSLTMPVPFNFDINAYEQHLNKKIYIEIGIKNTINKEYPDIIWFPQGIFILTGFSSAISNTSHNITIQAKDKMCLLNGDIGGKLTANYTFDSKQDYVLVDSPNEDDLSLYFIQNEDGSFSIAEEFDPKNKYYTYETQIKYLISDIIKNIVHELGKEPYHNIIIEDVDTFGLDLVKYNGKNPLYFYHNESTGEFTPGILKNDMIIEDNLDLGSITIEVKSRLLNENYNLEKLLENIEEIKTNINELRKLSVEYDLNNLNNILKVSKQNYESIKNKNLTLLSNSKNISLINLINLESDQKDLLSQNIQNKNDLNDIKKTLEDMREDCPEEQKIFFENIITCIEKITNISLDILIDPLIGKINEVLDGLQGIQVDENFQFNYFNNLIKNEATIIDRNGTPYTIVKINPNNILGYRLTDLIYPGKDGCLTGEIGASITSILDKIKQTLGDFEYFYDLNGRFVFRKTKLYVNNDWTQIINNGEGIFVQPNNFSSSISYNFEDLSLITQINQNPQINNLKNDFSIWGQYKTINNTTLPLHLRYAIDDKPYIYVSYQPNKTEQYCYINKDILNSNLSLSDNAILLLKDSNYYFIDKNFIGYNDIKFKIIETDWREIIYQMANDYFNYHHLDEFLLNISKYNRTFYQSGITGYEHYYTDMQGFWRELYNPNYQTETQQQTSEEQELNKFNKDGWNSLLFTDPTRIPFWFDFLDNEEMKKYSIKSLGDRQVTSKKDTITSIYYPNTPSILLYDHEKYPNIEKEYPYYSAYSVFQLGEDILEEDLIISSGRIDAFSELDSLLYKNLYCSESLTITCIPIFYLSPNVRIYIHSDQINLDGVYALTKITVPLSYNGTMQLTATKMNTNTFMSKGG